MSNILIASKYFLVEGGVCTWTVFATVTLPDGVRSGSHSVDLPVDATDDDLAAAVLAQYEPPAPAKKAAKK